MRSEAFGQIGLLPDAFYGLDVEEYLLLRKGYIDKVKNESVLLRFQTALICEALIGKGNGARFVMDSWQLENKADLDQEQVRALLKAKREKEALKRLKMKQNG
jgi:TfoX/Sxy family transcriptional regulator of competence genes